MSESLPARSLSRLALMIFAPVLVVTGIAGFVVPAHLALMSGETPYNLFHLLFGLLGLALLALPGELAARRFLVGFGVLDLYQALASGLGLWPQSLFAWTRIDDIVHVVVGLLLLGIGLRR